jgi:hypothetical protein
VPILTTATAGGEVLLPMWLLPTANPCSQVRADLPDLTTRPRTHITIHVPTHYIRNHQRPNHQS